MPNPIQAKTTAEIDIRNLSESVADTGRASIIFHCGDQVEVVHLSSPRDVIVVGRTFPSDVCIDLASLSRQHAKLSWSNGELFLEDLNSRNGTWMGGNRIQKRKLHSGDQITLGGLTAVVAISPPQAQDTSYDDTDIPLKDGALVYSSQMQQLYQMIDRIADNYLPVLILGETGTGKELLANRIHNCSARSRKGMQVVNCGAIPENLIESTLFGHERGTFTGAYQSRAGVFEEAQQGTIFLDEVAELPATAQVALLRVLETKRLTRLGGNREIEVDTRIIAATHCDIDAMISEGTFRQDLVHRLNTFTLHIPPLRERIDEIEPLSQLFIRQICRTWNRSVSQIDSEALSKLKEYSWPGNIRQLRNVIERGVLLCEDNTIRKKDLPAVFQSKSFRKSLSSANHHPKESALNAGSDRVSFKDSIRDYEVSLIRNAIQQTNGNLKAAARLLRMPYRTLSRKIKMVSKNEQE